MSISPASAPGEPEGPSELSPQPPDAPPQEAQQDPQDPQEPQNPYRAPDPYGTPDPYGSPSPYGPPAPHVPYGTPTPVNPFAVASLITGILCCLPGVGLLLGLIALPQIRKRGQRGRAAAVVGSALSGTGLALAVLLLTTGVTDWAWRNVKEGVRDGVSVALAKGDCFDADDELKGTVDGIRAVPCSGKHEGEVFATFTLKGGAYPDDDAVTDAAERCAGLRDAYAMDDWALPADVDVFHLTPSKETWSLGDREVTCVLGSITEGGTLTGSLRADESVLDADQVAYLKAAHVLDAAMDTAPDATYAEDDLPGHKAWAHRVSTALADSSRSLRAHPWPATARTPLADQATRLDKARALWDKAARATDADAFYVPYDEGLTLLEPHTTVPARKALKLATTPPGPGVQDEGDDAADEDAKV
ncbi:DUF4190 domain-containing protein [Streptomyces sp. NPDC085596]|uniref:DUF4190 domain-containing protein n=1 Tax=Streptomyces sp. NPDC085596 TaxID=3365731 RepID=UPI0037CD2624